MSPNKLIMLLTFVISQASENYLKTSPVSEKLLVLIQYHRPDVKRNQIKPLQEINHQD